MPVVLLLYVQYFYFTRSTGIEYLVVNFDSSVCILFKRCRYFCEYGLTYFKFRAYDSTRSTTCTSRDGLFIISICYTQFLLSVFSYAFSFNRLIRLSMLKIIVLQYIICVTNLLLATC